MIPCTSPGCPAEFPSGRSMRGHLAACPRRVWPVRIAPRAISPRLLAGGHLPIEGLRHRHEARACRAALDGLVDAVLGRAG